MTRRQQRKSIIKEQEGKSLLLHTYESVFFVNFVRSNNFFFPWKKKKNENFKAEITAVCSFFYKEEAGRENLIELLPLIKFSHNPEKDSIISDHAYFIYKEAI